MNQSPSRGRRAADAPGRDIGPGIAVDADVRPGDEPDAAQSAPGDRRALTDIAWRPAASNGVQIGAALLAVLVVLALLGLWQTVARDGGARLVALLLTLVAGGGGAVVGVLLRGLLQLRYWLRDDALEITWLGRSERVPWLDVQDAEWQGDPRAGSATAVLPRAGWEPWWPGYAVRQRQGQRHHDGRREVVLATMPVGRRVVLLHATGTLVISPERPVRFLSEVALRVARALEREVATVDASTFAVPAPDAPSPVRRRRPEHAVPDAPDAPQEPSPGPTQPVSPPVRVTPTLTATPRRRHQSAADGPGTATMPAGPIDVVIVDAEPAASPLEPPAQPARATQPERIAARTQPEPTIEHAEVLPAHDAPAAHGTDAAVERSGAAAVLHGFTTLGQERTGSILFSVLVGLPILLGMVLYSRLDVLPDRIPLHWDADNQPDRYGTERTLWLLPLAALLLAVVSIVAASWAVARDRVTTLALLWSAVLVQVTLVIAVLRLTG